MLMFFLTVCTICLIAGVLGTCGNVYLLFCNGDGKDHPIAWTCLMFPFALAPAVVLGMLAFL